MSCGGPPFTSSGLDAGPGASSSSSTGGSGGSVAPGCGGSGGFDDQCNTLGPPCLTSEECRDKSPECDHYDCEDGHCTTSSLKVGDHPTCGNGTCGVPSDCAVSDLYEISCVGSSCLVTAIK